MKYGVLVQIASFLREFRKITAIKRVSDTALCATFDGKISLVFDLNKSNSSIYIDDNSLRLKDYKAPFDMILAKRFTAAKIIGISVPQNNRILHIKARFEGSYKAFTSNLYLEFTGRFTNAIITDENDVILEALRHFSNEFRTIAVGKTLKHLEPIEIKEAKSVEITDFEQYFKSEFDRLKDKNVSDLKSSKIASVDKKIANLKDILNSLEKKEDLEEKSQNLAERATAITANLYKLKDFERNFRLENNGKSFEFTLKESPKIAANSLYKESKKLRQKAENIVLQKENLEQKIVFLNNLKNAVSASMEISQIQSLIPKKSATKKENKNSDLVENFYIGEFKISVGKNERGNSFLLKNARKDDFWFHVKDIPSSHVIVKTNKQSLNDEIIAFASRLCVQFTTSARGSFQVDFAKKMNVKIINGAFVNYVNYTSVGVKI